jgi:hypothetical protein
MTIARDVNVDAAAESVREAMTPEFVAKVQAIVDDQLKGFLPADLIPPARSQVLGELLSISMADSVERGGSTGESRLVAIKIAAMCASIGVGNQVMRQFSEDGSRRPRA